MKQIIWSIPVGEEKQNIGRTYMTVQYLDWADTMCVQRRAWCVWAGVAWAVSQRRKNINRRWTEFGWAEHREGHWSRGYSVRNLGQAEVLLFGDQWQGWCGWGQWKEGKSKPGKPRLESGQVLNVKVQMGLEFIFSVVDMINSWSWSCSND